jgi:hypothetical protein
MRLLYKKIVVFSELLYIRPMYFRERLTVE